MAYKIEKVAEVPIATKSTSKVYSDVLNAVSAEKEAGWYKVTIEGKKSSTVYQALSKLMQSRKDLKLHRVSSVIYIEKIKTK
jgi:hypothetical protein